MPRSKGPIGYIEHRSPMKDETGEYLIYSQFVAAIDAIEDEMLYALSMSARATGKSDACISIAE